MDAVPCAGHREPLLHACSLSLHKHGVDYLRVLAQSRRVLVSRAVLLMTSLGFSERTASACSAGHFCWPFLLEHT